MFWHDPSKSTPPPAGFAGDLPSKWGGELGRRHFFVGYR
jgi:hypothetical protein